MKTGKYIFSWFNVDADCSDCSKIESETSLSLGTVSASKDNLGKSKFEDSKIQHAGTNGSTVSVRVQTKGPDFATPRSSKVHKDEPASESCARF